MIMNKLGGGAQHGGGIIVGTSTKHIDAHEEFRISLRVRISVSSLFFLFSFFFFTTFSCLRVSI